MGWEKRRGKSYYYRKVWRDGRVVSLYCGGGARGVQAAREDQERRLAQQRPQPSSIPVQKSPAQPKRTIEELIEMLRESNARLKAQLEASPSTTRQKWQK
jgi:hypothetical protein